MNYDMCCGVVLRMQK